MPPCEVAMSLVFVCAPNKDIYPISIKNAKWRVDMTIQIEHEFSLWIVKAFAM